MARPKSTVKRPRVSEPNEADTDDSMLVDLSRRHAADDDAAAVMAKGLVHSEFLNPAYSDLSIICGDKVFPAHRVIICPQSKYFEDACKAKFEGEKGDIKISDRDATLVEKMLQFVYTGDCTRDVAPETQESTLKAKAKERFEKTFLNTLEEATFAATVIEVYTSTAENDRGLRDIVVQLTRNNLPHLRSEQNPIPTGQFLKLVPQFMLEICISTMEECARYQNGKCVCNFYTQPNCKGAQQSVVYGGDNCASNWGRGFYSMKCAVVHDN